MQEYVLGSRILVTGKQGRDVAVLQNLLNKMPWCGGVPADGRFSAATAAALRRLQRHFAALPDGVAGKDTYRLLGLEVDEYWPSSLPPPGMRLLRSGSRGRDVLVLQNRLAALREQYALWLKPDPPGVFRAGTEKALRAFQSGCGLELSGVLNVCGSLALYRLTGAGSRVLKRGKTGHDRGYDVYFLQQRLREKGFFTGEPDGFFTEETENAVVRLQEARHLTADGVVGRAVCFALGK